MRIFRSMTPCDLDEVMEIVEAARAYMKRSGIDQWQDGYPSADDYAKDIQNGIAYVAEQDKEIIGLAAVHFGHEDNYDAMTEGKWLTDYEYGAIHRIAVKESLKGGGIGGFIVENAVRMCNERGIHSLRCDTHEDNISMQRLLIKNGFSRCGTVLINNKTLPRVAFERII